MLHNTLLVPIRCVSIYLGGEKDELWKAVRHEYCRSWAWPNPIVARKRSELFDNHSGVQTSQLRDCPSNKRPRGVDCPPAPAFHSAPVAAGRVHNTIVEKVPYDLGGGGGGGRVGRSVSMLTSSSGLLV